MNNTAHKIVRVAALAAAMAGCSAHRAPGPVIPENCTNEREQALKFTRGVGAVAAWSPNNPFVIMFDAKTMDSNGALIGIPDFSEKQILSPLRDLNARFRAMNGYNILALDKTVTDLGSLPDDFRSPENAIIIMNSQKTYGQGWGYPQCPVFVGTPALANPLQGGIILTRHFFDPAVVCYGFSSARTSETVIHEIAHVFGMSHYEDREVGMPMSKKLSDHGRYGESDDFLTDDDIRNMGCIMPYRHFAPAK